MKLCLVGSQRDKMSSVEKTTFFILSRCTKEYFYEFNSITESFLENQSRPPLSRCAFTLYKNFLYAFGGLRNGLVSDVGLMYDTNEKSWMEFDCQIGKAFCEVCTVGDKVFLFGGVDNSQDPMNTCSTYSYTQDKWIDLPNMKHYRGAPAVAFYNSSLYVIGGFSVGYNREVERYDPRESKWSTEGNVNIFGVLSSAVIGNTIHILNSYSGKYCQYDPRNLTCTMESMVPFSGKAWLGAMNHQLHVIHLEGISIYDNEKGETTKILNYNFENCPCLVC